MLRFPHAQYRRLWIYHLDCCVSPPDDPDLIGTWIEDGMAILFFHRPKEEFVRALCQQAGASIVYQADLDYQEWEAGTSITSFSSRALRVRPVWEPKTEMELGRTEVLLDPGVVFGSGFHATTRLCLEALEMLMLESGQKIRSVLDLGTGTGLLALAAAKLGADRVTAVDSNPLAVQTAQRNVELNGCSDVVELRCLDLTAELPDMHHDLVVCNLYEGLLLRLFANHDFWRPGIYMASGFIAGMEPNLLAALPVERIQMLHRGNAEQWRLWLFRCADDARKQP